MSMVFGRLPRRSAGIDKYTGSFAFARVRSRQGEVVRRVDVEHRPSLSLRASGRVEVELGLGQPAAPASPATVPRGPPRPAAAAADRDPRRRGADAAPPIHRHAAAPRPDRLLGHLPQQARVQERHVAGATTTNRSLAAASAAITPSAALVPHRARCGDSQAKGAAATTARRPASCRHRGVSRVATTRSISVSPRSSSGSAPWGFPSSGSGRRSAPPLNARKSHAHRSWIIRAGRGRATHV